MTKDHECTCGQQLISCTTPIDAPGAIFVSNEVFHCPGCGAELPARGGSSTQWYKADQDHQVGEPIQPTQQDVGE